MASDRQVRPERAVDAAEGVDDGAATVFLIACVRWCGVVLGIVQATLVSNPAPLGGPWLVLLASAVMSAYNVPATLARRWSPGTVATLRWACLVGDFAVCTSWTMLVANDIYSTTYAIYILVGIEAAFLYAMRGAAIFSAAFLVAYALLYWERAAFFGFAVVLSSILFRSAIVIIATGFSAAITEQSRRRRAAALYARAEAGHLADMAHRRAEQLHSLLRVISDIGEGVVTVRGGRIVDANEAYCQLTGYELEELKAMPSFLDVVASDDREALAGRSPDVESGARGGETSILTKGGEDVPVEWATRRLEIDGVTNVIGLVRDIRDRKRMLEVAEAARDRAETASRAKSEYLSRMSHELRTPLTAILGFSELLQLQGRAEDREAVDAIVNAGDHLLGLINDVLDISRIESGKDVLALEPVSLRPVVEESVRLVQPIAEAHQVSLVVGNIEDGADCVHADRQRLAQVLINLLANGAKYTGGGATVTVSAHVVASDRVRIEVQDDGPGVAEQQVELVFEPFERLGAQRTGEAGTGLGLALAKRLVESMAGHIGLVSAGDSGCLFWLELDAASAPSLPTRDHHQRADGTAASLPATERLVLCIEDNDTTRALVRRIFELRPGLRLITAGTGTDGVAMAREHLPELILLDLHLPDMNGDEVLGLLRNDATTRELPVVILTADATQQQAERLLAQGARRYLTKPLGVNALLRVIDEQLAAWSPPAPRPCGPRGSP